MCLLGVFILYRISEQYGQGSQVTKRLHHLPFFGFFGKSLVKWLGSPETLLAFVLGRGAGFAASTAHVCVAAGDEPGYCSLAQTKLSTEHSVS